MQPRCPDNRNQIEGYFSSSDRAEDNGKKGIDDAQADDSHTAADGQKEGNLRQIFLPPFNPLIGQHDDIEQAILTFAFPQNGRMAFINQIGLREDHRNHVDEHIPGFLQHAKAGAKVGIEHQTQRAACLGRLALTGRAVAIVTGHDAVLPQIR